MAALVTSRPPVEVVAEDRLRCNPYLALRHIACEGHDGIVVLRGHVPSYFLKQIAQEVVAHTNGVKQVVNQLEVITALHHRRG